MQRNRLVDSQQFVESIRPGRANAQTEIDLRERSDRYRHGEDCKRCRWLRSRLGDPESSSSARIREETARPPQRSYHLGNLDSTLGPAHPETGSK